MKKTAFMLMLIGLLSKVFGFGRYIVLANYYGASTISDAYLISLTIPLTIFQFMGESISTTLIPIFNEITVDRDRQRAYRYINNLITNLTLITAIVIGLSISFAPYIVKIFASGFEGETLQLATDLTRITLLGIFFSVLMSILRGYLYSNERYYIAKLVGLPFNLIIMASTVISSFTNVYVLAYGTLLAMFSEFIIILWASVKDGFKYKFTFDIRDKYIFRMLSLATPTMIGTSVNQINKIVDRTIASRVAIGGISALNYANRLNLFIQQTFVLSISTVLYPVISKMAAENNIKGLKKSLREAVNSTSILVIPASIGAIVFSESIVRLLFMRGAFDQSALDLSSAALMFYSVGMMGFGLREILSRAFYSLQDTRTPMINASLGLLLNIILNIILSRFLGIGGLALATSIAGLFTTFLLFVSLKKKIGALGMKEMAIVIFKTLAASITMGIVAFFIYNTLNPHINELIALMIAVLIGALVYFGLIIIMKIDDVDIIVEAIRKKVKKRR